MGDLRQAPVILPPEMIPSTTHFTILVEIPLFTFVPYLTVKRECRNNIYC